MWAKRLTLSTEGSVDKTTLESHFRFGQNWERLVSQIDEARVAAAVSDIADFLNCTSLAGKSFLDIGCGSGLSSLAAYRLGAAKIVSIDIDPLNIQNVVTLKRKFGVRADHDWRVFPCSIVGPEASALEPADLVYSWGVLHHTGDMWRALDNCVRLVKPGGYLYIMLYRDAWCAGPWRLIKRSYTRGGPVWQWILRNGFASVLIAGLVAKGKNPRRVMRDYAAKSRGMSWYLDVTDWVGGYPFEYASAQQVIAYLGARGLRMVRIFPAISRKPLGWRGTGSYRYLFYLGSPSNVGIAFSDDREVQMRRC